LKASAICAYSKALGAAIAGQRESGSYGGAEIADIEGVIDSRSAEPQIILKMKQNFCKAKLVAEENELENIDSLLAQFQEFEASEMAGSKKSIESTIDAIKNSAEGYPYP